MFIGTFLMNAQEGTVIYKGFYEGMSKKKTLSEYEKNFSKYTSIVFNEGPRWEVSTEGFSYNEYNLLYGIDLTPMRENNDLSSYDFTRRCLVLAKEFIENEGFEVFYEPDYWNAPEEFNSFWGLIMINEKKKLAAHFFPSKSNILTKGKPIYKAHLRMISYEPFIKEFENLKLYYDY